MSVEARFKLARKDFTLDVDFSVPTEGVTAIMGPSGCGKTTLLRSIAGLEHCQNGYLKVGSNLWQDQQRFLPTHKRALGYVFQEASLFSHLSVNGNLQYGLKRIADSTRAVSLHNAVELLGIGHLLDRDVEQLSGGEKQRVAIARALALNPEILLMDEPLAALDAARKQEIMPYLETVHAELNIPVIYVSHSVDEVARIADRILLMENGRISAQGETGEVLTRLDLSFASEKAAAVYLDTRVVALDKAFGLCELDFPGGRLRIAAENLGIGQIARVRVAARDVSLTLARQTDTSILNIFPVIVEEISEQRAAQLTVRLLANGVPVLSRITRKSATLLGLEVGKQVFAQLKSVALV